MKEEKLIKIIHSALVAELALFWCCGGWCVGLGLESGRLVDKRLCNDDGCSHAHECHHSKPVKTKNKWSQRKQFAPSFFVFFSSANKIFPVVVKTTFRVSFNGLIIFETKIVNCNHFARLRVPLSDTHLDQN